MQNSLLANIGNELAKKPFEWMSWWWGLRWGDFISVDPPLTVDNPLWNREESNLKSVQLFGLSPDELQAEVIHYWQQAFWKRWLLGLFTPIHRKIKLLAYYHRCKSFHTVCIKNLFDEEKPIAFVFEKYLGIDALYGLNKRRIQIENYLEQRTGNLKWKNNNDFMHRCFRKDWGFFKKLMKKKLAMLSESDKKSVRSQLEKEYDRLDNILSHYLSTLSKNIFNLPSSDEPIKSDTFVDATTGQEISCSIHWIEDWVKIKRQRIKAMLQEKSAGQFLQIKNFLESCFSTIRLLAYHQIVRYEKLIDKVINNQFDGDEAIQRAETLQTELIYFFRKSVLLFHPDKSLGNEPLQAIQTELFKMFKQLSERSLGKIKQGLQTLKVCLPGQRNYQEVQKMEQNFDLQVAELEQRINALYAKVEQAQAETEADLKQIRAEIDEMKTKIDEFIASKTRLKLINKQSLNSSIQEDNETEIVGRSFHYIVKR
jgi:hypothetical protein